MSDQPQASTMPPTPSGVVAYLTVSDAAGAIAFYEKALGAKLLYTQKHDSTGRIMHAALDVNGGRMFLADDFPEMNNGQANTPETFGGSPVTLHIQVDDVDATVVSAVEHGASVTFPVTDMFWGDRFGKIRDPFGHEWSIATPVQKMQETQPEPALPSL